MFEVRNNGQHHLLVAGPYRRTILTARNAGCAGVLGIIAFLFCSAGASGVTWTVSAAEMASDLRDGRTSTDVVSEFESAGNIRGLRDHRSNVDVSYPSTTRLFPEMYCAVEQRCEGLVQQWRVIEIILHAEKRYGNPFMDVKTEATFVHEDGTVIKRPAFWDGELVWKIRFAPTKTGHWGFTTESTNSSDSGLNSLTGNITAMPYTGDLAVYRHGFLTASQNGRHLSHADGTPFFYLADTHWFMEREDFNNAFEPMVKRRIRQGFTAFQSHPGTGVLSNEGATRIEPDRYKTLDRYFRYIAERGLVHAFGIGAHVNIEYFTTAGAARLAQYLCARYAAFPVIFFTSQEVDWSRIEGGADRWKPAFDAWTRCDEYDQPATAHLHGSINGEPTIWGDDPEHTLFFLQAGHGRIASKAHYAAYWKYEAPTKPFLEAEANYEEIRVGREVGAGMVRRAAYKAIQSGAAGFGYGAAGIWNYCKQNLTCGCCERWGVKPWSEAIELPGGGQMMHLSKFYTQLPWWRLVPRFDDSSWAEWDLPESSILSSVGAELYVIYFYGSTSKGFLKRMATGQPYKAAWFDPRTGTYLSIESGVSPVDGRWEVPEKPSPEDWILLVEKDDGKLSFQGFEM